MPDPVVTDVTVSLPRPMAPGALTSPELEAKSMYKSMRRVITALQTTADTPNNFSFGAVDTTASDGSPLTFKKGDMDVSIVRVAPSGSTLGVENVWVAGGGNTTIVHHLGRQPIGSICTYNTFGAILTNISWDATNAVMQTTHSNADTYIMFF